MEIRRAVTGITSLGLALATLAAVQGRAGGKVAPNVPAAGPVLEARFVNGRPTDRVIVPMEGWPLTLTLRAKEGSLMGLESGIFPFPRTGQTGSLVFSVSGSAPAEGDGGSGGTRKGSAPAPVRLDFEPGWNLPEAGARPTDGAPPRLWTMGLGDGFEPAPELAVVGPPLGSSKDGYGYGPNPLLPGLVLLADAGPGVVTDERFERPSPRRARNLAGFFQSLGYELRDARGATTLTAHMNVPWGLLSPVVLVDAELGGPCALEAMGKPPAVGTATGLGSGALGRAAEQTARRSESIEPTAGREAGRGASGSARSFVTSPPAGDMLVRIDGGPVICRSMKKRPFYEAPPATVTVRAFVVAGKAPAELVDRDGDGVIDLRDARRSGLRLLSSEAVFSFEVYFQGFSVLDLPNHFYSDLDGNGQVGVPPGTEAGPAQLTDPPR